MSPGAVALGMFALLCLVVIVLALLFGPAVRERIRGEHEFTRQVDHEEDVSFEADTDQPQPIDPQHPPRYSLYRPRDYDVDRAPKCTCHGETLRYGQKVLLWPIPGHPEGGMDIFCEKTYGAIR